MQTVGEILKKQRQQKNITLEEINQKTRISVNYLKAIEENNFRHLPAATFTKGFLKNYALAVGLNPQTVLAIFRRDYDQDERGRIIPRGLTEPVKGPKIKLFNPTTTVLAISGIFGLLIAIFFAHQIYLYLSAPSLQITAPPANAQVITPFEVRGTTTSQAQVTVNNKPIIVDESGNFKSTISLSEGQHLLIFKSTNRSGKSTTLQHPITIVNDPNAN